MKSEDDAGGTWKEQEKSDVPGNPQEICKIAQLGNPNFPPPSYSTHAGRPL